MAAAQVAGDKGCIKRKLKTGASDRLQEQCCSWAGRNAECSVSSAKGGQASKKGESQGRGQLLANLRAKVVLRSSA
jgi:hypothetical protein